MTITAKYNPSVEIEVTDCVVADSTKLIVTINTGDNVPHKFHFKDYDNSIALFSQIVTMLEMVKQCGKKEANKTETETE